MRVDPIASEVVAEIHVPGTGYYGRIAVGKGSRLGDGTGSAPRRMEGNLVRIDPATDEVTATITSAARSGG